MQILIVHYSIMIIVQIEEGATLDNDDDDEEEGGASSTLLLALIDQPWVYCPPNTTLLRSMIITMTMIIMMVTMRMVSIQH